MNEKETDRLVDPTGRHSADPKHQSVALPAGSFDVDALDKALNATVRSAEDKRETARAEAVDKVRVVETKDGVKVAEFDPAAIPGYETVEVKHDELDITEQVRVYAGEDKAKPADKTAGEGKGN